MSALALRQTATTPMRTICARSAVRPALRAPARKMTVRASAEPAEPVTSGPMDASIAKAKAVAEETLTWIQAKWEATEASEKPAVVAILAGVVLAQVAVGATIDAVDRIPLLNTLLELVGLAATAAFIFKLSTDPAERDEVKGAVTGFLSKITGDQK
ncbi:hypothetical protein TSOC_003827 [Tetrabaena socialis]|uniref:Cyanobacterial aminoacyl-tRNA synthetase CAAD domain-containing protein n=1 Tax=Tetrabaena socialis TaxID=47790 RepID=A0A2J8AAL8_9CHLO|nr:hypothetical protein TSOC_003827 [Tetrabaena socialis]|eukprot:PNH09568.1 hypothetical protein TSOC_003827 [Tetrabaena socialis]